MNIDATRAHIDAETMAAWADHGLSAEAAALVELHLSNCDRCQEVLAAFVRSGAPAGAVILPFWSRRPVQWSAAGLAAAAAVVAMIWIGQPPAVHAPETTVASRSIDSISPIASPSSSAPPASQSSSASAPTELRRDKPTPPPSTKELRRAKATPVSPARVAEEEKVVTRPAPLPAPPPPAPIPQAPLPSAPPVTSPSVTVTAASPVVLPPPAAAVADRMESFSLSSRLAEPTFEVLAPVSAGRGGGGGGGGRGGTFQSTVLARWRVLGRRRIERSTDAGTTWVAMPLDPPLTTPLMAGAATSQVVCWFVGENGVVLLSTDGRTLRRVSLPESVTLNVVTPVDGLRATVTAIDGRKFTTIDGGLTWK